MSNQVYLLPTEFKSTRTGEIERGFRVFDDYDQGYEVLFEGEIPDDDLQCLRLCREAEDAGVRGIIEDLEENQKGLTIGETFYSWEEIEGCFKG